MMRHHYTEIFSACFPFEQRSNAVNIKSTLAHIIKLQQKSAQDKNHMLKIRRICGIKYLALMEQHNKNYKQYYRKLLFVQQAPKCMRIINVQTLIQHFLFARYIKVQLQIDPSNIHCILKLTFHNIQILLMHAIVKIV